MTGLRSAPEVLAGAERILVLKLDELGDFILATPMLRALRAAAPKAQIMLAVTAPVMALTENCPHVDAVVTPTGDTASGKFSFRGRTPADLQAFAAAFRAGFDLSINARFDFDKNGAATLAAASRAPVRLAYAENVTPWKADNNRGFDAAYTRLLPAAPIVAHEVERGLALVAALGGAVPLAPRVELYLTPAEKQAAAGLLSRGFPGGRPRRLLAVAPTANAPRRDYPITALAAALNRLVAAGLFDGVALLGAAAGAARAAGLADALSCPALDLTGRTSVREAAAAIAACDGMAGMDSGPVHMAAALGVPVAAFCCHPADGDPAWPQAPARFRPWGEAVLVLQPSAAAPPCVDKCVSAESHCIAGIDPIDGAERMTAFFAPHFV